MSAFRYLTCCVNSDAKSIDDMVDQATEIQWKAFWSHVDKEDVKLLFPDYVWGHGSGLKLHSDYAVYFYRSKYQKKPCYYLQHSAIEYIFVEDQ